MTRSSNFVVAVLVSMLLSTFASTSAFAHKAIILVRHAEKASQTDPDPALSMAGEDRALALARLVRNAGVTHVFVSDKQRTALTAEPVAMQKGLKPVAVKETKDLITQLKAAPKDAVIVVVGHSNTIPEILKGLGVVGDVVIKDDQYGRVFFVGPDNSLVELAY